MPLFKYGATEPTEILINGNVQFPLIGILGSSVTFVTGDFSLPIISVQCLFAVDVEVDIPRITVLGKMQDEIFSTVKLPVLDVYGEILGASSITGSIKIRRISVYGDMQAECSMELPALRVLGILQNEGTILCLCSLPEISVLGEVVKTEHIIGAVLIPNVSIDGRLSKSQVRSIDCNVSLHLVSVNCIIPNGSYTSSIEDEVVKYSSSRRLI